MIAITGATGQLGRLVIESLLKKIPASEIVAIVRDVSKAADLSAKNVAVRSADYGNSEALANALMGVDRLLLISSSELGHRVAQHGNVITAAKRAGVKFIAYTSLLHADRSPLSLAGEHLETEALVRGAGIPFAILRNGWYYENNTASLPVALKHGALVGGAGNGRFSWAARTDYADAAAEVLTQAKPDDGRVYELAGDSAHTLTELAAEVSRQSGRTVPYLNLLESEYAAMLRKAGLPAALADGIASWDVGASEGALFDDGRELARLIGRPTTILPEAVAQALRS